MKIILLDSWNQKFSGAIANHWRKLGHQVIVNPPWEALMEADLTFFYQADNVLVEASTKKIPHTGRIAAQCVDIEVWAGQPMAVDWTYVDALFFMAKHIRNYVLERITPPQKTALIKPGIDLSKWSLRPLNDLQGQPIRKLAYIVGDHRIWDVKRLDIAFQLLKDLMMLKPQLIWQLHVRGTYSSHVQYNAYCQYLEQDLKLKDFIIWYPDRIEDMNKWLDDKDYFILPSTKEAFSYATAEAMAKGIKPIINNWEGSKDTWAEFVSNTYGEMLSRILEKSYEPKKYREYIENNYSQEIYFDTLDSFLEIK